MCEYMLAHRIVSALWNVPLTATMVTSILCALLCAYLNFCSIWFEHAVICYSKA